MISSIVILLLLIWFWVCLPGRLFNSPTSYVLNDYQGVLMGASIASDGQWRFPYDENVPDKFKQCITTFEDKRFDHHFGVDFMAMGRAIKQNLHSHHVSSGGSTITMQVIHIATKHN